MGKIMSTNKNKLLEKTRLKIFLPIIYASKSHYFAHCVPLSALMALCKFSSLLIFLPTLKEVDYS